MPIQTFNPDHVLVSQKKDGTFNGNFTNIIMKDVAKESLVMKLGKYVEMNGKQEEKFLIQTDGVSAYWVDETEKIKTDKPELRTATLRAKKLGIILVASREALNYTWKKFFNDMKPQIVEAFHKKIDEAAILGKENPFANSVLKVAKDADNIVEGEINYDNYLKLEEKLLDKNVKMNAIVSKMSNRSALREVRDGDKVSLFDRGTNTLDGLPLVDMESDNMLKGDLITGDFNNLVYGVPYNINFQVFDTGTVDTLLNADGSPVNLLTQEMIALRCTMDIAVLVTKDETFAQLTKTKQI